jgi:GT2 family glycosyltransferase
MNSIDVSIVIVNWNTREILQDCLRSVYEQTQEILFEVIVIDNASSDGSAEMVRQIFPTVTLIENTQNRGFAAANNQGIGISRGRYVLLLNSDTIVLDGAVQKSVRYADRHPDVGILGCQVWENETTLQRTCFRFPSVLNLLLHILGLDRLFPQSRFFGREKMAEWKRDTERDVDVVSGMFMLVRREAMDQIGGMDEDYFVYAEETDWCKRFWKAGWRCVFSPVARIIHRDGGSKSTEQVSVRMFVQQQKSLLIFHRKQCGWFAWIAARFLYILFMLIRYLVFGFLSWMKPADRFAKRAAQSGAALRFHLLGIMPK